MKIIVPDGEIEDIYKFSPISAFMLDNPIRRFFQNPVKILSPYIRNGMTVIDIGCGPGMFSLVMAELVGPQGKVIAVDLQQEMLDAIKRKSDRSGLTSRMRFHRNTPGQLGIPEKADFILSFYMVHEVPDQPAFFREVKDILKPHAKYLLVEPGFHVSRKAFYEEIERARRSGLAVVESPKMIFSRAAVFETAEK